MSSTVNVNELLKGAQADGMLSPSSHKTLTVVDLGQQINAAMGVSIDEVEATESILVATMPDDSGSIRFSGNADAVRQGHNEMLKALGDSKEADSMLVMCRLLNGDVVYPYCLLSDAEDMNGSNYNPDAEDMNGSNYNPDGITPLYDEAVTFLGAIAAKAQEAADLGNSFRAICMIITDGADEHSRRNTADDVKGIVDDLLQTEQVVVAGFGVQNNYGTDFEEVFDSMGIPREWQLTTKSDPSEIRRAFQLFSKSAVRMSQAAPGAVSTSMGGGFGA
jgi:hypothetical protein